MILAARTAMASSTRLAVLALLVAGLGCPALALADTWWTYKSLVGGSPAITRIDLGLHDSVPKADFPDSAVVQKAYEQKRADGIPDPDQDAELRAFEAKIVAAVSDSTGAIAVGSFSQSGLHSTYFYMKSDPVLRDKFKAAVKRLCPTCSIAQKPEPDWSSYRTYLYPNQATLNYYHADLVKLGYVK